MKKAKKIFMSFNPMMDARRDVLEERKNQIKKLENENDFMDEVDELFENPLKFISRKYYYRHAKSHKLKLLLVGLMILFIGLVLITMFTNDGQKFNLLYPILVGIVVSIATMVSGHSDYEKEEYNYYYIAFIKIIETHTERLKIEKKLGNNLTTTLIFEQEVASTTKNDEN